MNRTILHPYFLILLAWSLTACGDLKEITNDNAASVAPQQSLENGSKITRLSEFPPSICQRHERRNYQAALDKVDNLNNPIVLVGELHGNRNSIEFIHEYILRSLVKNKKVLLSLEATQDGNFIFDQVWDNQISLEEAWQRLPDTWYWNDNTDHRQSCAIALLLNDLFQSGHSKNIDLLLTSQTPETAGKSILKGHVMASQLHQRMKEKDIDDSWNIISLTGRNYQRLRPRYSIEEQSTMCGRLRQIVDRDVLCVGAYGSNSPEKEAPCSADEAFDIITPKLLKDPWDFYEGLEGVLVSQSRCADFTPRALEKRARFQFQKAENQ